MGKIGENEIRKKKKNVGEQKQINVMPNSRDLLFVHSWNLYLLREMSWHIFTSVHFSQIIWLLPQSAMRLQTHTQFTAMHTPRIYACQTCFRWREKSIYIYIYTIQNLKWSKTYQWLRSANLKTVALLEILYFFFSFSSAHEGMVS